MFGIENSANNFGRSAGLLSNTYANIPNRAALGTIFIASDTFEILRWNGTGWDLIGGGGAVFGGATNGLNGFTGNLIGLGGVLIQNTQISCSNYVLKFDGYEQFAIGNNTEPSMLFDTVNQKITTSFGGSLNGLECNYANDVYNFGDFINQTNGTYIMVDNSAQEIKTWHTGSNRGLLLDFANLIYTLGDYNGSTNQYYITIDDGLGELRFNGANLQSNSASGNSGEHLVIWLNGTNYKIKLENP